MSEPELLARVSAHKGVLIFIGYGPAPRDAWVPAGGGRIGCVVLDSAKNVGISPEALELLRKIPRSHDAIGDVDWWKCDDDTCAFAWLGGYRRLINAANASGSRDYVIGPHVVIENEIPDEVKTMLDAQGPE